jgi:hypothetical protein
LPLALVPFYVAALRFRTTPLLLLLLWPLLQVSIAGLLLHAVQSPYWILNIQPVAWPGKISDSLYLWQQLFAYGPRTGPGTGCWFRWGWRVFLMIRWSRRC